MHRFEPVAGVLALDFVNTLGWRDTRAPDERLRAPADLVAWAEAVGLVSSTRARRLDEAPAAGSDLVERARSLRESLYRLFVAFAAGKPPRASDLVALNRALAAAPKRDRLSHVRRRFVWKDAEELTRPEQILWAVAWSASKLLTEERPERVKRCAGDGCGWLFLDTSRSRARRWCSMSDCGNRAKAKRHYARTKKS